MKEQLISFDTAKLAKEKGFNWNTCDRLYNVWAYGKLEEVKYQNVNVAHPDYSNCYYPAPTQSLLQKWLREKYNLDVLVTKEDNEAYNCFVWGETRAGLDTYNTYEQALEKGLQKALKLI